ncbi:hypothetical protein KIPB_008062 [Kipferlia bialata]|uniref:BED-type domain-containing protein n=1 Tax=Kipferlia bialata TaxID=797122 RepID=A0A9K3CZF1_9EUKA|nr:hypothetical protein KIPB_008062 [Kipferlia bialata]|eukprot:g8062.t1
MSTAKTAVCVNGTVCAGYLDSLSLSDMGSRIKTLSLSDSSLSVTEVGTLLHGVELGSLTHLDLSCLTSRCIGSDAHGLTEASLDIADRDGGALECLLADILSRCSSLNHLEKKERDRDPIWSHYVKERSGPELKTQTAKCKLCQKEYHSFSNLDNLRIHMRKQHSTVMVYQGGWDAYYADKGYGEKGRHYKRDKAQDEVPAPLGLPSVPAGMHVGGPVPVTAATVPSPPPVRHDLYDLHLMGHTDTAQTDRRFPYAPQAETGVSGNREREPILRYRWYIS